MRKFEKSSFIYFAFFLVMPFSAIKAQDNNHAFDTFSIGINVVKDIHQKNFHKEWEPQLGAEGFLSAPFYAGNFQAGVTYSAFGSSSEGYPDFKLFFFYAQWDYEYELSRGMKLALGGRAGLTEMRFDENDVVLDKNLLHESEFAAGLIARLSLAVTKSIKINFNGHYLNVFTYPQMNLFFVGAGISKSFSTPGWLKEFVK